MAVAMFAAIEIGSYALEMKIFEISMKGQIREIDRVFHVIELGKNSYNYKRINFETVDEVCDILYDFKNIMKEFGVKNYRACATSAVREAANCQNILDRIKIRTGMDVDVLSNSELRFIFNKAVAFKEKNFGILIQDGAVLLDVGSGSVQLTIYDEGRLIATQNLRLGSLRMRDLILRLKIGVADYIDVLEEYVNNDLLDVINMHFKDVRIKHIIVAGNYAAHIFSDADFDMKEKEYITKEEYERQYTHIIKNAMGNFDEYIGGTKIPTEILVPSAIIYKKVLDVTNASKIWFPNVNLCHGMVVEYAQSSKRLKLDYDFTEDIINAASMIARRYHSNFNHLAVIERSSLKVFDVMKKYHGLKERERLLLRIAVILHDCGKYINIQYPGESCYNIIMGTEIIGLSHKERVMVANIAKYNTDDFDYEEILPQEIDRESYLVVIKLVAILRICNALDSSYRQKFKSLQLFLQNKELIMLMDTFENIAIEKGLFAEKASLFEDVYGIKPVLKVKRGEL